MQTFLPHADIRASVKCLDYRRLGKQRVEAHQILRALRGESKGWRNHACTRMWRGHEDALEYYKRACILEWIDRGYKNTMTIPPLDGDPPVLPSWFGDLRVHASHRANLLRKDPVHYGQYGWTEDPTMPYFWPR